MINGISSSMFGRPPMTQNITKDFSGLTYRETEILGKIKEKVSSEFDVPVKLNHGSTGPSGLTVAFTGFSQSIKNGVPHTTQFLIMPQMLAEAAECEERFISLMEWVDKSIQRHHDFLNGVESSHRSEENTKIKIGGNYYDRI